MAKKGKTPRRDSPTFNDGLDDLYNRMQSESADKNFRRLLRNPPKVKSSVVIKGTNKLDKS